MLLKRHCILEIGKKAAAALTYRNGHHDQRLAWPVTQYLICRQQGLSVHDQVSAGIKSPHLRGVVMMRLRMVSD